MTEVLCVVAIIYLYGLIRAVMDMYDAKNKVTVISIICVFAWPFVPPFVAIAMGLHK